MTDRHDSSAVKALLATGALLLAAIAAYDPLVQAVWVGVIAIVGLLSIIFVGVAVVGISVVANGPGEMRGKAVQIVLILAIVGASLPIALAVKSAGRWAFGRLHLERNLTEFDAHAGDAPIAFSYLEGIPDGGVSIVRSAVDPDRLPRRQVNTLLNGQVSGCRSLRQRYWLCGFG